MAHFLHVLLIRHASQLCREFLRTNVRASQTPRIACTHAAFLLGTGCCRIWRPRVGDAEGMSVRQGSYPKRKRAGPFSLRRLHRLPFRARSTAPARGLRRHLMVVQLVELVRPVLVNPEHEAKGSSGERAKTCYALQFRNGPRCRPVYFS